MFVFFKQKTAYEMRISDWSSDVCSSDLTACQTPAPAPEPAPPPPVVQNQKLSTDSLFAFGKSEIAEDGIEGRAQLGAFAADLPNGRASGRARGCPYVSISVVDGTFKKK